MKEVFYSDGTITITQYDDSKTILEKGWYYWDETGAYWTGPFETEETAKQELKRYGEFLNSEPRIA